MECPACHYQETKVIDSRPSATNPAIRRRRECLKCAFRFSTYEQMEILDLIVLKKDGAREPYKKSKLEVGIRTALKKRPFTEEDILGLVANIERDIQLASRKNEITSKAMGDIVMQRLRRADQVAYIRFASVYEDFQDIEHFENALEKAVTRRKKR